MLFIPKRKLASGGEEGTSIGQTNTASLFGYVKSVASSSTGGGTTLIKKADDVLENSSDAMKTSSTVAWTKVKEVKLTANLDACRIKFDLSYFDGGGASQGSGKLYKNGVAIGALHNSAGPWMVFTTFSEDFTTFVTDDLIQIYVYVTSALDTVGVKNFRFYYSDYISIINNSTLTTPLVITTTAVPMITQDP